MSDLREGARMYLCMVGVGRKKRSIDGVCMICWMAAEKQFEDTSLDPLEETSFGRTLGKTCSYSWIVAVMNSV